MKATRRMKAKTKRNETAEARRQLIVEVAALCFIEHGFHQTSVRDIAKRAGISLGNLYNHFESKEALIAEIATLEAQDLDEFELQISEIEDASEALDQFVKIYLEYCCRPENTALAAEITSEALRNPEIGASFQKNRSRLTSLIAELIEKHTKLNGAPASLKPSVCAEFVLDLIEGLAMRSAFAKRRVSKKDTEALRLSVHQLIGT